MKVSFFTLGCKVNTCETEYLREQFIKRGYEAVEGEKADVFVVNSCTVTHIADRKGRGIVRKLRRENPSSIIILTGCMPQINKEDAFNLKEADIVLGNGEKDKLFSYLDDFLNRRERIFAVGDIFKVKDIATMSASKFDPSFQKAYLKIEDGCDNFCTYCAIGFARGRVRSESIADIQKDADKFIKEGYKELILTGINLSRYGFDLGLKASDGIRAVCEREGDFRVRLGSVEPNLMDIRDFEAMRDLPKLCPHFHLALQSGCDETLKRMGRRYTTKEYMSFVDYIFKYFPNPSITTDIIVGFPGETEDEFKKTCRFVSEIPFLKANIFPYSPRLGTRAASFPDQIHPDIKKERNIILNEIAETKKIEFLKTQLGREARVLGEKTGTGYTDNYVNVSFGEEKPKAGDFSIVKLSEITSDGMTAHIIKNR